MHCEGKLKLKSLNTSYCLIKVVTKVGLTKLFMKQNRIFLLTVRNRWNIQRWKWK